MTIIICVAYLFGFEFSFEQPAQRFRDYGATVAPKFLNANFFGV
jgi:hypothetical protein